MARGGMRKVPSFPPTPVRLQTLSNFTGGLNTRGNAFQLAPNETPDCLDVDLQIGGGFLQRKVVVPYGTGTPSVAFQNMWTYATLASQQAIGEGTDGKLYASDGTNWAATGGGGATARQFATAAEFNGDLYVTDGTIGQCRWDGSTATTLGVAWSETIGTEGAHDGNAPVASLICAHLGRMFVAGTVESSVAYPNRIRWSHAGFPENWRQEDFIDIDVGRDGDQITAITEFRERLYIFKNDSTYELSGYGPSTFQVVPIAQDIGCVGPLALCLSDVGLFTFSWPQGVYLDKGTGPYPIFAKIQPMIRDGFIPAAYRHKIALGYVNQNVWCAIPWQDSTVNARVLVYDPWIWVHRYMRFLEGPWYPYSLGISAFCTLESPSGYQFLAANSAAARVGQLEQVGNSDNWGGGTTGSVNAYYRTDWFDMGQEAVFKRWRHPEVVMRAGTTAPVTVDVYRDYDPDTVYSSWPIQAAAADADGLVWATETAQTTQILTVVPTPTGTTTVAYVVTALVGDMEGDPTEQVITDGCDTLGSGGFNVLLVSGGPPGTTSYNWYKGTNRGLETLLTSTTDPDYVDTGALTPDGVTKPPAAGGLDFFTGGLWDDGTGTVGGEWFNPVTQGENIVKGLTMGSARAVQLVFTGPENLAWGVDAFTLKMIPKRIHG